MIQQVADHLLAAVADRVVQEGAAVSITMQEVTTGTVQLLELWAGHRAGMGLLRAQQRLLIHIIKPLPPAP